MNRLMLKQSAAYKREKFRSDKLNSFAAENNLNGLSNKEIDDYAFDKYRNAYGNELRNYGKLVGGSLFGRLGLNWTHKLLGMGLSNLGLKDAGDWIGESNSKRRNWGQWGVQTLLGLIPAYYGGKYGYRLGGDIADSYVKGNFGHFEDNAKAGFNRAFSSLPALNRENALERALRSSYLNDHVTNKYNNAYLPVHMLSALAAGSIGDRAADNLGLGANPGDSRLLGFWKGVGKGLISSAATAGGASIGPYILSKIRSTSIDPLPAQFSVDKRGNTVPVWDRFYNNWLHAGLPGGYITSPYYAKPTVRARSSYNGKNRDAFFRKMVNSHDKAMARAKNISTVSDAISDMLWTYGGRMYTKGRNLLREGRRASKEMDSVVPPDVRYRP